VSNHEEVKPIIVTSTMDNTKSKKKVSFNIIKRVNEKKEEKPKKKKKRVLRRTPDILPFLSIDESTGFIKTKYGYMDILQIESTDVLSMKTDDQRRCIYGLAKFLRVYVEDFKFVSLTFPVNTYEQQQYLQRKIAQTNDPTRLKFLNEKLLELQLLEKNRVNLEYYIFLFAKDLVTMKDNVESVIRISKQAFPLKKLSMKKKLNILFKLNNQSSKIL